MDASDEVIINSNPSEEQIKQTQSWGTWSCGVSRFNWTYSDKETCYILEGMVEVTNKNGKVFSFKKGDWVIFPQGMSCVWDVKEAVKKHYKFG